jgi:flagellar hook-length control protein FliK
VPAQIAEAPDARPPAVPADTPDAQPPTVPAEAPDAQPPTVPAGSQPAKPGTDAPVQAPVASTAPEQAPPAADAPSPAPPAAAPAPPPAPAPQPSLPLQRAASLHHAPRAVAQVLELAVERGISHAKLSLRPADLGGVEIRLQSSSAGVTAQVVADSPEAARLLQHAAADLRRALERHDVTLLSLDVSTAGDGRPDGSAGASADLAGDRARHFAAQGLAPRETADSPDEPPTPIATVQLPDGLHVDVLA